MSEQEKERKELIKYEDIPLDMRRYGGNIRELIASAKVMIPNGSKMSDHQGLMLIKMGVVLGLNPFIKELWFDPYMGIFPGIEGYRRKAREIIASRGGGNFSTEFEVMSDEEKEEEAIPLRALAYRCKLKDSKAHLEHVDSIERLLKAGMPWDAVLDIVGKKPFTEGIGYVMPEQPDGDCPVCGGSGKYVGSYGKSRNCKCSEKSTMPRPQLARKRAEAHALKQAYGLHIHENIVAEEMATVAECDADVINGDFKVSRAEASRALYGDGDGLLGPGDDDGAYIVEDTGEIVNGDDQTNGAPQRPYDLETLKAFLQKSAQEKYAEKEASPEQRGFMAGMLEQPLEAHHADTKDARYRLCEALTGASSSGEISGPLVWAIFKEWLDVSKDANGKAHPSPMAAREIIDVLAEIDGQAEMQF